MSVTSNGFGLRVLHGVVIFLLPCRFVSFGACDAAKRRFLLKDCTMVHMMQGLLATTCCRCGVSPSRTLSTLHLKHLKKGLKTLLDSCDASSIGPGTVCLHRARLSLYKHHPFMHRIRYALVIVAWTHDAFQFCSRKPVRKNSRGVVVYQLSPRVGHAPCDMPGF